MTPPDSRPRPSPQGADGEGPPGPGIRGLALLLLAGLVLHGFVLRQAWTENPFARELYGDAEVYWEEAGRIAGGELVGDAPFFSAPLYPYLLGLIRALGGGLLAVYGLQLALHLATAGLLWRVGRERFRPSAGLGAAAVWLVCADPAYYTARLLAGTLQAFLVALTVERALAADARPTVGRAALLGLVTGVLVLAWPPAQAMVPVIALAVAWRAGWSRAGWRRAALAAGAAALAIAPATLHNRIASGEWILVSAHGGLTFYHGNNPAADGTFSAHEVSNDKQYQARDALRRTREARGPDASWKDVSGYFFERGVGWWRAEPARALGLAARKAWLFLGGRVYGDMYLPTFERSEPFGSRLRLAFVPVAWCTLPALVLALILLRRPREHVVLLALVGLAFAVCTVFWYSPRYRIPVSPIVVLLAAAAVARLRDAGRKERAAVVGALVLGLISGVITRAAGLDRPADYRARFELRLADLHRARGEVAEARAHYERARDLGAADASLRLAELLGDEDPAAALEALASLARANPDRPSAQRTFAIALAEAGRFPEARVRFEQALSLEPDDGASRAGLATVLLALDEPAAALPHLERALELLGPAPDLHFNRGIARRAGGDLDGAVEDWRATLALAPEHEQAASALFGALLELGRDGEAADVLRGELERRPDHPEIQLVLAWALATSPDDAVRDGAEAASLAESARARLGDRWDVLDTLAAARAELGEFEAAIELARAALANLPEDAPPRAEVAARLAAYEAGKPHREPR